jgi:diguanylate cyclase (GGDEF)-like protein
VDVPVPVEGFEAIPNCLKNLAALSIALIGEDGTVIEVNRGFALLASSAGPISEPWNATNLFLNPVFSQLAGIVETQGCVYQGILNMGAINGVCRSVHGSVYRAGKRLLVVAEPDILELERLNAMVIGLNDELTELQRDLVRNNRELRQNEAKIRELMLTDPLTGLANRRRLSDRLEEEILRFQRDGRPLCLVMADIDHFKRINDTYGHDVGDDVIRMIASSLQEEIRKVDLAARFGGEEFVVIMPDCVVDDAIKVAERVRSCVEATKSAPVEFAVTASFGVAEFRGVGDTAQALLKRADQALYVAKEGGRNRVEFCRG